MRQIKTSELPQLEICDIKMGYRAITGWEPLFQVLHLLVILQLIQHPKSNILGFFIHNINHTVKASFAYFLHGELNSHL